MPRIRTTPKKTRPRVTSTPPKRKKRTGSVRKTAVGVSSIPGLIRHIIKNRRIQSILTYTGNKLSAFLIVTGLIILFAPVLASALFDTASGSEKAILPSGPSATTNTSTQSTFGPIRITQSLLSNPVPAQPPQRIIIPQLSIDLPVHEANIVNGYWETSETTASHGLGSAYPGQNGNIVIFAHARDGLFAPLKNITPGTTVYVLTNDRWHEYRITTIRTVLPDETEVIEPTEAETLTLFTCTGFLDTKRLVVTALPDR